MASRLAMGIGQEAMGNRLVGAAWIRGMGVVFTVSQYDLSVFVFHHQIRHLKDSLVTTKHSLS